MYSITVSFGSNLWAFLFKDKDKATTAFSTSSKAATGGHSFEITDDFGQQAVFSSGAAVGINFEDLDLTDEARIYRSLANARGEVKARQRAATDPVIRAGMQQGPGVIAPSFGR